LPLLNFAILSWIFQWKLILYTLTSIRLDLNSIFEHFLLCIFLISTLFPPLILLDLKGAVDIWVYKLSPLFSTKNIFSMWYDSTYWHFFLMCKRNVISVMEGDQVHLTWQTNESRSKQNIPKKNFSVTHGESFLYGNIFIMLFKWSWDVKVNWVKKAKNK